MRKQTSGDHGMVLGHFMRRNAEHFLTGFATFVLVTGFFFLPPSITGSVDYVCFYKLNFHFLIDAVKEGRLPLWNPYIGLGRPFLTDLQNAVFYPPIYLILLGRE